MSEDSRFDERRRSEENGPRDEETVKVNDRRMFTPEGELREEYRFLDEEGKGAGQEAEKDAPQREAGQPGGDDAPRPAAPSGATAPSQEPAGRPETGSGAPAAGAQQPGGTMGSPSFYDLVSILAEPIAVYLGDAKLPDGRDAENLDLARLHIDLLDLLQEKTEGNLDSQEAAVLEDLLYRLRMRYVQKRG